VTLTLTLSLEGRGDIEDPLPGREREISGILSQRVREE
jgi:hypothetical protein